jgi:hypothetical protein
VPPPQWGLEALMEKEETVKFYVHVWSGFDDPETWEPVEEFFTRDKAEEFRDTLSVPSYIAEAEI